MAWDEILKIEERTVDNLFKINLFLEGQFWHAYEWSAFLCHFFPSSALKDEQRLKPTRKAYKETDLIVVGFKMESFEKYLPDVINNEDICIIKEKEITINIENFDFIKKYNITNYKQIFNEWKQNFNISKQKQNEKKKEKNNVTESVCAAVCDEICNLQLEVISPIYALCFLSRIKQKLFGENS